jgi:peptide/nickel transport system permease protein
MTGVLQKLSGLFFKKSPKDISSMHSGRRLRTLYRQSPRRYGLLLVSFILLLVIVGPLLISLDPLKQNLSLTLCAPGWPHLFGSDHLGRSVLSRLLYGGRSSLLISFSCTTISLVIGSFLGVVAGYREGWSDLVVMRLVDGTLAFPGTLLAIILAGTLGGSMTTLVFALSATMWCDYCRLVRNMTRSLKQAPHLEAGRLLGFNAAFLIRRYIFVDLAPQLFTLASLGMGRTILNISGLGFLGIGLQPPLPEWGSMINQGIGFMSEAPWLVAVPGILIFLTVFGFQLMAGAPHGR